VSTTTTTRPAEDQLLGWMQSLSNWGRWGADDQRGTLNLITPDRTRHALSLVREGATVSCAHRVSYEAAPDVPLPPQHYMLASGDRFRPGEGPDRQASRDYIGLVFHGHTITHIDSLAHFFWDGKLYNGQPAQRVSTSEGATSHSVEEARMGIITRGVLVDVPMLRGVEFIERGDGVIIIDPHGDLALDNVLLDDRGRVTGIVDFGDIVHTALLADLGRMHGALLPVTAGLVAVLAGAGLDGPGDQAGLLRGRRAGLSGEQQLAFD